MWRRIAVGSLFIGLVIAGESFAQYTNFSRDGLVSPSAAHRYGLTRRWHTQVDLDGGKGEVTSVTQHVSSTRARTIWQVTYDQRTADFSESALDKFGEPLGPLGAARQATELVSRIIDELRRRMPTGIDEAALTATEQAADQVLQNIKNELDKPRDSSTPPIVDIEPIASALVRRAETTPDGIPKLERVVIPETTLYAATNRGIVHAIDAETGATRWSMPIGNVDHLTLPPAANDQYVCVINGSIVYLVNNLDGKLVWQRQMKGVPGAGAAVTENNLYIPLVGGAIEIYSFVRLTERYQWPSKLMSTGRGLVPPTTTENTVCWPTDRGYFYVADAVSSRERFRLEANQTIVSQAAYVQHNKFVVASIDGYVYCVQEFSGEMLWRFSTGQPISHQPIAVGKAVYVITDEGEMFRINSETGQEEWWTPGIRGFVSASDSKLYCTDRMGRIAIIDMETGGRVSTIPVDGLDLRFVNIQTDRMIVGTTKGLLQCLHETKLDKPLFHIEAEVQTNAPRTIEMGEVADKADGAADPKPADTNPFGGGAPSDDPFGGAKPMDDPFGGGAKPPAAGGGGADPFGSDAKSGGDPFGAGAGAGGGAKPAAPNPFGVP